MLPTIKVNIVQWDNKQSIVTYLTESAVNTLSHIDIVASRASTAIGSLLSLNGNGLSWADGFAQFTCDASLLTARVSSQGVLTTETRAQRSLLERIIDGGWFLEDVSHGNGGSAKQFRPKDGLSSAIRDISHLHALLLIVDVNPTAMFTVKQSWVRVLVVFGQCRSTAELRWSWSEKLFS